MRREMEREREFRAQVLGLGQNHFKGGVISGLVEERQSAYAPVQDMVGEVAGPGRITSGQGSPGDLRS